MPQVLIIQHVACEPAGTIEQALARADIAFRYVRPFVGEEIPASIEGWDGLVVMGGSMGGYQTDAYPHLRSELQLIGDACSRNVPVLGICLGSQLLAAALGELVAPGERKEIGWFPVSLAPDAASDPLFAEAPRQFTALHWHGDVFGLPAESVLLASSRLTPRQAFRWRDRAYGILFHMETTASNLEAMTSTFHVELAQEKLDAGMIRRAAAEHLPQLAKIAHSVFASWAKLVRASSAG